MENPGAGTALLDHLFSTRSFCSIVNRFPTLFCLLPETDSAYDIVVEQMTKRANGIDVLTRHYVCTQNLIFGYLKKFPAPFNFVTIPEIDLYIDGSTEKLISVAKTLLQ